MSETTTGAGRATALIGAAAFCQSIGAEVMDGLSAANLAADVLAVVPALAAENERLREALVAIRDHGSDEFPCHAVFEGDCEDVMREIARAALGDGGERC